VRWFEKCPERLEYELRALRDAGLPYEVDEAERAAGRIVLTVTRRIDSTDHKLRVTFPPHYPYFPFHVVADSLNLDQHQDPYSKLVCLVEDIQSQWKTSDTVALYLTERLQLVLDANRDPATARAAREGAPATGYMRFEPEAVVLVADWAIASEHDRGSLLVGIESGNNPHVRLRGAVLEVRNSEGALLAEAEPRLKELYLNTIKGRWVRLPRRPTSDDPRVVIDEARARWPALERCVFNEGPDVVGVLFADEAQYRQMRDIWTFVVRRQDRKLPRQGKKRLPPGDQITLYLARPDYAGRSDLQARAPRLRPIATKKIALFGLGALGSMVAWQLVRAGIGHLVIVDHDFVQAGGTPRWAMGLPAAGHQKVGMLFQYFRHFYPYVEVTPIVYQVGATNVEPDVDEQFMTKALDGVDMVVDCTVEFTVNHFLSSIARERGIPYVWARATTGAWGGIVGRVVPNKTPGCWKCFQQFRTEHAYPLPAEEEGPDVQPIGCFSPTFTGTGFDLDHVSLEAVRLIVGTLCLGSDGGYPDGRSDLRILELFEKDGQPIPARWATRPLERHQDCDAHG